jgi:hypothetical protein
LPRPFLPGCKFNAAAFIAAAFSLPSNHAATTANVLDFLAPRCFHQIRNKGKATLEPTHRKLTTHQKAVLIQVLRTFPDERVSIRYSPSVADSHVYAQDFLSVFRAIGWDVDDPQAEDEPAQTWPGLALLVNDGGLPPCAEALRDALRIYGIEVETHSAGSANLEIGRFVLIIGRGC